MSQKLEYYAKRGLLGNDAFKTAHTEPTKLQEMFPQLAAGFDAVTNSIAEMGKPATAADEKTQAPNLRNKLVDTLGLPEDWKQTVADEKRWAQEMPTTIGSSAGRLSPQELEKVSAKLAPDLAAKLKALHNNAIEGVDALGPMNGNLQKLKDLLGNVGRTTFKSK